MKSKKGLFSVGFCGKIKATNMREGQTHAIGTVHQF
jgi:hypothetical protein